MTEPMRKTEPTEAFPEVPPTVGGHFVLYLYAAIFRLIFHVQRLSEAGGATLEEVFEKYPFLGQYFAEMREHMPEELTWADATLWWRDGISHWEDQVSDSLPLRELEVQAELEFPRRLAFLLIGLVEEDSRFGTLMAELQQPLAYRRPTLELVGQIISDGGAPGEADAWSLCRPLLDAGLVEVVDRSAPRAEWVLRIPPLVWDAVRGELVERPTPGCRFQHRENLPRVDDLACPPEVVKRLERLAPLLEFGRAQTVILRCPPGSDPQDVLGALAGRLGRHLLWRERFADDGEDVPHLGALATLTRALPVTVYDLAPGETAEPPGMPGYGGPRALVLGLEGGVSERAAEGAVTLTLPFPRPEVRERCWRQALADRDAEDLPAIADKHRLGPGFIRRAAQIAVAQAGLDGRETVVPQDVREATRVLNRQLLDTLAQPLPSRGAWADLVVCDSTLAKLEELERRCRHRERVLDLLGRGFRAGANGGVRALLSGASGTGKTLAARILSAELGMDLYRVDLAAVINKYIGETEKNLHKVLSRAEALDVVLLLDEGDALLGTRTEVRSANDRYANLETNYLLQRLETYQGIVLVTTNLGENIDSAFQRRMDVVVPFFPPQPEERRRILDLHLPDDHRVTPELLDRISVGCELHGGQLRNAALHAILLALEDGGGPVDGWHFEEAVRSEYRKAGAAYPLAESDRPPVGNVEDFMAALEDTGR